MRITLICDMTDGLIAFLKACGFLVKFKGWDRESGLTIHEGVRP